MAPRIDNPYWREFRRALDAPLDGDDARRVRRGADPELIVASRARRRRDQLVHRYAWAVPSNRVIHRLATLGPLVEVGAGGGYWAHLIDAAGGDILAYDVAPPGEAANPWYDGSPWHPVHRGGPEVAGEHPERTLLLCWPPFDAPVARRALESYRGNRVVYVGEDAMGCTAERGFFTRLEDEWVPVARWSIPQWPGLHDALRIYRRRQDGAVLPRRGSSGGEAVGARGGVRGRRARVVGQVVSDRGDLELQGDLLADE